MPITRARVHGHGQEAPRAPDRPRPIHEGRVDVRRVPGVVVPQLPSPGRALEKVTVGAPSRVELAELVVCSGTRVDPDRRFVRDTHAGRPFGREAEDDGQQVVEVVCDPAGQSPDRVQLLRMEQLLPAVRQRQLGLAAPEGGREELRCNLPRGVETPTTADRRLWS